MNYYASIKEEFVNNEIYKKVKDYSKNKNDLDTYYKVGKLLSQAGKHYGEGIILCRRDHKFIMEYCSDKRVLSREYRLINTKWEKNKRTLCPFIS